MNTMIESGFILTPEVVINYRNPDRDHCIHFITKYDHALAKKKELVCSPSAHHVITSKAIVWLLQRHNQFEPDMIKGYDVNRSYEINYQNKKFIFALLESRHSAASISLLLHDHRGSYLYTGPFCYYKSFLEKRPLVPVLENKALTKLFYDDTYIEMDDIPSFDNSVDKIVKVIKAQADKKIIIVITKIDSLYAVIEIAARVKEKIFVSQKDWKYLKVLGYSEYFMVTPKKHKIKLIRSRQFPPRCGAANATFIKIVWHNKNCKKYNNHSNVTKNKYTFHMYAHSLKSDCLHLIKALSPRFAYAIFQRSPGKHYFAPRMNHVKTGMHDEQESSPGTDLNPMCNGENSSPDTDLNPMCNGKNSSPDTDLNPMCNGKNSISDTDLNPMCNREYSSSFTDLNLKYHEQNSSPDTNLSTMCNEENVVEDNSSGPVNKNISEGNDSINTESIINCQPGPSNNSRKRKCPFEDDSINTESIINFQAGPSNNSRKRKCPFEDDSINTESIINCQPGPSYILTKRKHPFVNGQGCSENGYSKKLSEEHHFNLNSERALLSSFEYAPKPPGQLPMETILNNHDETYDKVDSYAEQQGRASSVIKISDEEELSSLSPSHSQSDLNESKSPTSRSNAQLIDREQHLLPFMENIPLDNNNKIQNNDCNKLTSLKNMTGTPENSLPNRGITDSARAGPSSMLHLPPNDCDDHISSEDEHGVKLPPSLVESETEISKFIIGDSSQLQPSITNNKHELVHTLVLQHFSSGIKVKDPPRCSAQCRLIRHKDLNNGGKVLRSEASYPRVAPPRRDISVALESCRAEVVLTGLPLDYVYCSDARSYFPGFRGFEDDKKADRKTVSTLKDIKRIMESH